MANARAMGGNQAPIWQAMASYGAFPNTSPMDPTWMEARGVTVKERPQLGRNFTAEDRFGSKAWH